MTRRALASSALLAVAAALPAAAQTPQFRADVRQTGDEPFQGTFYFGASKVRIEGTANGEQVAIIVDANTGTMLMIMPTQRMVMTMDIGSAPFSAPGAASLDPNDPCSGGEVTDCENLGTESVNGFNARKWAFTMDGERQTSWIAPELRFPVRTVEEDGTTIDFTNVTLGPQPASLFEAPADYTAMDMGAMMGGRGGRGRGAPPAGRGQMPSGMPPGGLPPGLDPAIAGQLAGLGLDSTAMAQMAAMGVETNSAPWEAGDGWVVELVVTASGTDSGETPFNSGSYTSTYSARFTASVPFPYGTPAVGAAVGPAWQLVPTLGSPRGLAEPLVFSGTTQFHSEGQNPPQCPIADGGRWVTNGRGTGEVRSSDHNSMEIMTAQARWEISGDLRTHHFMVAVGTTGSESMETANTSAGACGDGSTTTTDNQTREPQMTINIDLTGLPLAATPGTMRGTATAPMRFQIGDFDGELPAQVEWTLRQIR